MNVQEMADAVIQHIQDNPDAAEHVLSNPMDAVKNITGESDFNINEVFGAVTQKLGDSDIDLSNIDFSKLDLSQLDPSQFDLGQVMNLAKDAGVDISDLAGNLNLGDIAGNLLGGLFGNK